jgi:peptide/nickel transport system permease protein
MLARYTFARLVHALLLLAAVSVCAFLLLDLAPGDYFDEPRLDPRISPEAVAGLRAQYGLTQPLPIRYARWLASAWHGDFGISMAYNMPAAQLLAPRARNTLLLTITALLLAWALGVPLGVWSAASGGRLPDRLIALSASILLTIPELLFACALLFLAAQSGWLPAGGMRAPGYDQLPFPARLADLARHMILPVTVLAAGAFPQIVRHVRASVAEVLGASFIAAARAHGIPPRRLIWRHILPAAANPLISLLGLSIGGLVSASMLVEVIFGWPGLGPLFLDAVSGRDVHVLLGAVILSACFLIAGSLLSDLLLYVFDPRIRGDA